MEYLKGKRRINTARSIRQEKVSVNSDVQDPAYQAYLQAVLAGRAKADAETMGHRQDLAPSLAAKMSKAFGMDLSQMKLYRTGAMEGTETKGMASGNKIVLSKDIDLNTMAGQAVLGHEISHVRAQSQGIGMGHSGLYQNAGLEHQADVEGMMAARGQSVLGESTGMDTGLGMGGIGGLTPLGPGMSASAGAPMQAKDKPKGKNKKQKQDNDLFTNAEHTVQIELGSELPPVPCSCFANAEHMVQYEPQKKPAKKQKEKSWKDIVYNAPWKLGKDDESYEDWAEKNKDGVNSFSAFAQQANESNISQETKERRQKTDDKYKNYKVGSKIGDADRNRVAGELINTAVASNATDEEVEALLKNLYDPGKDDTTKLQIKEIQYRELMNRKKNYGILPSQLGRKGIEKLSGLKGFASHFNSGLQLTDANEKDFNVKFKDEKKENEYQLLRKYYIELQKVMEFEDYELPEELKKNNGYIEAKEKLKEYESQIEGGPSLNKKQLAAYQKSMKKRKTKKQ